MNNNDFGGTIGVLGGLSKLQFVDLSGNELTGNLMDARNLTELKSFKVDGNQLSGSLPVSFAGLESLGTTKFC